MKIDDSALFFTCSLLELMGRITKQKPRDIVTLTGEKNLRHIYQHADTLHCEPIAKTADFYIDFCNIPVGNFDNVASCKYAVPTYWDIGKVYARLIEDIAEMSLTPGQDVISLLSQVYNSSVSDSISNFNSDFFYQPRDYIKEFFLEIYDNASQKPAVRFAGFTDPWEQRRLGEIGKTYTGLSGKTKDDFGHGSAKFVPYLNVFSNPITDPNDLEYVKIDSKQNTIQRGDVFFTTSSETPDEVGMSSVFISQCPANTYLNSFCFGYRLEQPIDLYYLAYFFRADIFRKSVIFLAQGISRYNISKNRVMELPISIPDIKEQEKIGKIFHHLDDLIALHQRKQLFCVKV